MACSNMSSVSLCESGNSTKVLQEEFSAKFEFPNFEIEETYQETNNETIRRVIAFDRKLSSPKIIGQTINFASSWCVSIRCQDKHARVALHFQDILQGSRSRGDLYAVVKFRINLVDESGDILYVKQWKSWQLPRKIYVYEDYAMVDFISLEELFDSRDFLMPNKTLRALCDGVLYSGFVYLPVTIGKHLSSPMIRRPDLLESGEYSDVQLVAGTGKGFKAHKMILSPASHTLRNLLQTVNTNGQNVIPSLHLEDCSELDVSNILEYIYTGGIRKQDWSNLEQVAKLISLAKHYELFGLKWLSYENLLGTMTLSSFPEIAKLFQKNAVEQTLRASLNRFCLKHQEKLVQSKSFKKFTEEEKDAFLYVVLFHGRRA